MEIGAHPGGATAHRGTQRTGSGGVWNTSELHGADQEKEKHKRNAVAGELDMPDSGRNRKDMLQQWTQRLEEKVTP